MRRPPSFTHFDLPGDFHLAVNSNRKMKTVLFHVTLVGNLDERVTWNALLPMILRRGTRTRPDMQSINRHLEELYGTSIACYVQKMGERHLLRFRLEVVNERFLPEKEGIVREGLSFLHELLHDPLVVEDGFHPAYLDQEKSNLKLSIESLLDSKEAYAAQRLNELMCPDEPYRLNEQGRVEDLPGIDAASLRRHHQRVVDGLPLFLHVAGDLEVEAARGLVEDVFIGERPPRTGGCALAAVSAPSEGGQVREGSERMDVHQARLHLGFRHGVTYGSPLYQALLVLNGILGAPGFPHSKLFQNVREKASLAYSAHSEIDRSKGLLFISSGIAPENRARALEIILEQVQALRDGHISCEEMDATVAMILNSNHMLEDDLAGLAEVDLAWRLHGRRFTFDAFREGVRAVRREHVVEAASLLRHDATFCLMP